MVMEFSPAERHTLLAIEDTWIKTRRGVAVNIVFLFTCLKRGGGLLDVSSYHWGFGILTHVDQILQLVGFTRPTKFQTLNRPWLKRLFIHRRAYFRKEFLLQLKSIKKHNLRPKYSVSRSGFSPFDR